MEQVRTYPWLRKHGEETRQATANEVRDAIAELQKQHLPVSLNAIKSEVLRSSGRHIATSTIIRNSSAYRAYCRAATSPLRHNSAPRALGELQGHAESPRSKSRFYYLRARPKDELIVRLIDAEDTISKLENNEAVLREKIIELETWRLKH